MDSDLMDKIGVSLALIAIGLILAPLYAPEVFVTLPNTHILCISSVGIGLILFFALWLWAKSIEKETR